MNKNDAFFGELKRLINSRNLGIPGRTKMVTPEKVYLSLGNHQPDRFLIIDTEGHIWQIGTVFEKNGDPLTTTIQGRLELHFDKDGEAEQAIHQGYETEYVYR